MGLALLGTVCAMTIQRNSAASAPGSSLIKMPPSDAQRVELRAHRVPMAQARFDAGAVSGDMPMVELKFILRRSAAQETALEQLLEAQQTPGSAQYHRWLTPAQFGAAFGASDQDLQAARTWLESHSFKVGTVPSGRGLLPFSGTAAQVQAAFQTPIHHFVVNGVKHFANTANPTIPAAFQPLISGIRGLHDFHPKSSAKSRMVSVPDLAAGGGNYVGGADFAAIYSEIPLLQAGLRGNGITIAVASQSDIDLTIPTNYWSAFGVRVQQQVASVAAAAATDPGRTGNGDESEAYLDVEIAGAVAPESKLLVVRDKDVGTAFEYAIDKNLAGIVNISYSACEQALGSANASVASVFKQAAAQGITVVVSAGDGGIADCDDTQDEAPGQTVTSGLSVNGFASTPYDIAVGGTDFNPLLVQQGNYWSTINTPPYFESVRTYIPEMVWNDSCGNPVTAALDGATSALALCNDPQYASSELRIAGAGGGFSSCITLTSSGACAGGYAVPSWQTGVVGTQGLTSRAIPDVSLIASSWVACDQAVVKCSPTGALKIFSGTSEAAPAMSGLVALLDGVMISSANPDGRQGNMNPTLYKLAAQEYGSAASPKSANLTGCSADNGAAIPDVCIFNDITTGSNTQPCKVSTYAAANSRPLSGCASASGYDYGLVDGSSSSIVAYAAAPGYDLASGLGSVNASIFVEQITGIQAPTNLVVALSGTSANLSWTGLSQATSYNIYESPHPGGRLVTPLVSAVHGTATVVTGLQPGQTYYFTVTANVASGETYPSSQEPVTLAPAAPTGVTVTGAAATITLSWSATAGATSYQVLQGTSAGSTSLSTVATGLTDTSYSVPGTPGTTLYFEVVAVGQGGSSPASAEVSGTVLPIAPTGVTASAGNAAVTLHWTAGAGAATYNVYEGGGAGKEGGTAVLTGVTSTSATVSGLSNGTAYYFTVASVNSAGMSEPSSEVSATPSASPGKGGGGSLGPVELLIVGLIVVCRGTLVRRRGVRV